MQPGDSYVGGNGARFDADDDSISFWISPETLPPFFKINVLYDPAEQGPFKSNVRIDLGEDALPATYAFEARTQVFSKGVFQHLHREGFIIRVVPNNPAPSVFSATPRRGRIPLEVRFTSNIEPTEDLTLTWDFGDVSPKSQALNPVHTYRVPGAFTVTLQVDDAAGSRSYEIANYINASTSSASPRTDPHLSAPTDTLDFGPVILGGARQLNLSITNSGRSTGVSLPVSILGVDHAAFFVTGERIQFPGVQTTHIPVSFIPFKLGQHESIFHIEVNNVFFETLLRGRGVLGPPRLQLQERSLDFGSAAQQISDTLQVEIGNTGDDTLHIRLTTTDSSRFAAVPAQASLGPDMFRGVAVVFDRVSSGPSNGMLFISSNDPDKPSISLDLTGSALPAARIAVRPASLSLNNGHNPEGHFWIENVGDRALTIDSIKVDPLYLAIVPASGFSVAAGVSQEVTVQYTGRPFTSFITTATIHSDALNEPAFRLDVLSEEYMAGDFNADGKIDLADFYLFAEAYFSSSADARFDLDKDGNLTLEDFYLFASHFDRQGAGKLLATASSLLGLSDEHGLGHSFPNPFNSSVTVPYAIGGNREILVSIDVYNAAGQLTRRLVRQACSPGDYQVQWDARDAQGRLCSTGIYFIRFALDGRQYSSKVHLIR